MTTLPADQRLALSHEIQAFVKYCEAQPDIDEFNLIMVQTVLRSFALWLTMSDEARHGHKHTFNGSYDQCETCGNDWKKEAA